MRIDYQNARSLCTAAEFDLLLDTKPKSLTALSVAQLKRKAAVARRYSDKWREQAKRGGYSKDGSAARSRQKHELFREALNRIEARIARIEKPVATAARAKKKTAKKAAKKAVKKPATASPKAGKAAALSLSKRAKQKAITTSRRIEASGLKSRIHGHISARGRRNQAARSSRKRS